MSFKKAGYASYFFITMITATYFFDAFFIYIFFLSLFILALLSLTSLKYCKFDNNFFYFFVILFLFLFLFSIMSAIRSEMPLLSLQRIVINFLPLFLLFFIPSGRFFEQLFILIIRIVFYFVIVSILYSIFLFFLGGLEYREDIGYVNSLGQAFYQKQFGVAPFYRLSSFFDNPNQFSMWLITGFFSGLILKKIGAIQSNYYFFLIFAALFFAFSRASFLALMVFVLFYNVIKNTRTLYISVCLLVLLILFFNFFPVDFISTSDSNRTSVSLNSRGIAWDLLLNSFYDKPFFGVGFGVLDELILNKAGVDFSAHNVHLQFLSEVGLLGYFTFIFLAMLPIYYGVKVFFKDRSTLSDILLFSSSWCFCLLVHQLFENTLFRGGFFTLFWCFVSISIFKLKKLDFIVKS